MQKGIPPKIVRMWAAQVPALAAIRKEMETMLSFKLIVTLAVVVFMTISLVIHKVPYGITGMTCVVILAFAGALDAKSAFSGFSNTTVILVATMMVIAGALGKTSVVSRVRKLIGKAQVQMLQYLGCKRECGIRRTQLEAMRHRRHLHQKRI